MLFCFSETDLDRNGGVFGRGGGQVARAASQIATKKYEQGTDSRKIISTINVYVKVPSFWSDL